MWPADISGGRNNWYIGMLWPENGAQESKCRLSSNIRKHARVFCFLFKANKLKRFFYEQLKM